jgi:hypothetical protein
MRASGVWLGAGRGQHHGQRFARFLLVVDQQHAQAFQRRQRHRTDAAFLIWRHCCVLVRACAQRELNAEGGAGVFAAALGRDPPAMQLDQVPHQEQAEPEPAVVARGGSVGLAEAVEQMRQKFG